jgi:phosphoribosyl 1,2-cyclic phosphodiesterase
MKTVLLIDDEPVFREVLGQLLEPHGWKIIEAGDGETGLVMLARHKLDLVLCDLMMPRCNGFADEYLVKPVPLPELLAAIERVTAGQVSGKPPPADRESVSALQATLPHTQVVGAAGGDGNNFLRFWGVRGSIPTPGASTMFYGGNTSCLEVRADGEIIILDAGSGIRPLGLHLASEFNGLPLHLTLLISHTHWDHIQGFPFFLPAYNPVNQVHVLGYEGSRKGLEAILSAQMESPYFPIGLKQMPGNIQITELREFNFKVGRVKVQATFTNHPGICMGYRLETSNGSIAYLPDNEPFQRLRSLPDPAVGDAKQNAAYARTQDQRLIDFVKDVDVLVIDAQYNDREYQKHVGWGHGCLDDVVALAILANVKRLFLFHHDPGHDDAEVSRMVAWARQLAVEKQSAIRIEAAREGIEVFLRPERRANAG